MTAAQQNIPTHFFMDEVLFAQPGVSSDFVHDLSRVQPDSFIWIACKKNKSPDPSQPELKGRVIGFQENG